MLAKMEPLDKCRRRGYYNGKKGGLNYIDNITDTVGGNRVFPRWILSYYDFSIQQKIYIHISISG